MTENRNTMHDGGDNDDVTQVKQPMEGLDQRQASSSRCTSPEGWNAPADQGILLEKHDKYPTDLRMQLNIFKAETEEFDKKQQEHVRDKLRFLETQPQTLVHVLNELSARLLSIHSDWNRIVITFKTFEEIGRFSTYFSLGLVRRCLENFLFHDEAWLVPDAREMVQLRVKIDKDTLQMILLGLLIQEGPFFARVRDPSSIEGMEVAFGQVLVLEEDSKTNCWKISSLSGTDKASSLKASMETLGPFHQWFLKSFTSRLPNSRDDLSTSFVSMAAGSWCRAQHAYVAQAADELTFVEGERLEAMISLQSGVCWLLARSENGGRTGFVPSSLIRPESGTLWVCVCINAAIVVLLRRGDLVIGVVNFWGAQTPSNQRFLLFVTIVSDITFSAMNDLSFDCKEKLFHCNYSEDFGMEDAIEFLSSLTGMDACAIYKMDKEELLDADLETLAEIELLHITPEFVVDNAADVPGFVETVHWVEQTIMEQPATEVKSNTFANQLQAPGSCSDNTQEARFERRTKENDDEDDDDEENLHDEVEIHFLRKYKEDEECQTSDDVENTAIIDEASSMNFLLYLNTPKHRKSFEAFYREDASPASKIFQGCLDESMVEHLLEDLHARAKHGCMLWALSRVCFLLGRHCAQRVKLFQARVYFEEALAVIDGDIPDLTFMNVLYTSLTRVYLRLRHQAKADNFLKKTEALLLGAPEMSYCHSAALEVLNYILRRAVLTRNEKLESRACILISSCHLKLGQISEALPFVERLQYLADQRGDSGQKNCPTFYNLLSFLYNRKCLPRMCLACSRFLLTKSHVKALQCLQGARWVVSGATKDGTHPCNAQIPALCNPYFLKALEFCELDASLELRWNIHLSISELYRQHGYFRRSTDHLHKITESATSFSTVKAIDVSVRLAWINIQENELQRAKYILAPLLKMLTGMRLPQEEGAVCNILGLILSRQQNIAQALMHFRNAFAMAKITGNILNQAVCRANVGFLAMRIGANVGANLFLQSALELVKWKELTELPRSFVLVPLSLGQMTLRKEPRTTVILYHELALLLALSKDNLKGQLLVTNMLCRLYKDSTSHVDLLHCYRNFQLALVRSAHCRRLEGCILQALSHLHLEQHSAWSYQKALDHMKNSLAIFIDLHEQEKVAWAWLWAARIHHDLGQNEVVDLHLQMALAIAENLDEEHHILELYEAAGDIYFNGNEDREKALSFYERFSLREARGPREKEAELRITCKLTHMYIHMRAFSKALEVGQRALRLSVHFGDRLCEKVSCHRLAMVHIKMHHENEAEIYLLRTLMLGSTSVLSRPELTYCIHVCTLLGHIASDRPGEAYKAIDYYSMALLGAIELENKKKQLHLYTLLATLFHSHLHDRVRSLYFYEKARALAVQLNVHRVQLGTRQLHRCGAGPRADQVS
uniref:SH3 domain and tetratricopeptide repeat-containing protein 1 n=1 Tax=Myxine glutinosa TaxID=7769 RepID=UPI00358F512E